MRAIGNGIKQFVSQLLRAFFDTFKTIANDKGIFIIMILAPIFYAVYYPWPYSTQITRHIPVAIVDHANDSLSRHLIRYVSASPMLIIHLASDERVAKQQLLNNQIMAYMIIPEGLRRETTLAKSKIITMVGNGSYVLPSKNAQQAMAKAVTSVSTDIEIKHLSTNGLGEAQITAIRNPVPLIINPLNNKNEGYGNYVVPAVAWLILQQTLLIACAMLVGSWLEVSSAYASPSVWLARVAALSMIHYVICLGCTGWFFSLWGYESGGNLLGNLLLIALFSPCIAAVGFLLGILIKDRERSMQLLLFSALPMYFLSGYSWPTQQMPEILQHLRWVLPSSSVIQAGVSLNQLGETVAENAVYFFAIATIGIVAFVMLFWFGREKFLKQ